MIRAPLVKALGTLGSPTHQIASKAVRTSAALAQTPAKAPEKIEVFVDDIPVKVAPGTTVLQVSFKHNYYSICEIIDFFNCEIIFILFFLLHFIGSRYDWCRDSTFLLS